MGVEKVVDLISESAGRLAKAARLSRRDEKWWAALAKEDWTLIQLAWHLRGVILKRGQGTEALEELGLNLNDNVKEQIEEILKRAGDD